MRPLPLHSSARLAGMVAAFATADRTEPRLLVGVAIIVAIIGWVVVGRPVIQIIEPKFCCAVLKRSDLKPRRSYLGPSIRNNLPRLRRAQIPNQAALLGPKRRFRAPVNLVVARIESGGELGASRLLTDRQHAANPQRNGCIGEFRALAAFAEATGSGSTFEAAVRMLC